MPLLRSPLSAILLALFVMATCPGPAVAQSTDATTPSLGSRANNAKRRLRLLEFDVSEQEIARLHGPIGLYIGSRTPPEIAISILAEITAVKNGVDLPEAATIAVAKERMESVACQTS